MRFSVTDINAFLHPEFIQKSAIRGVEFAAAIVDTIRIVVRYPFAALVIKFTFNPSRYLL
jgi:hypothetical protein